MVPPFLGLVVVTFAIKVGDGLLPLFGILFFGEGKVVGVDGYVVSGVEFEDVVAFLEVARSECEGITALLVVARVVGARGWCADRL